MKNHIAILIGALALCSCEDYLTQENPNKIESEYYFTDESSLEIYTNGFIRSFATAIKSFVDGDKNADTHSWDGQAAYFMDNYSADDATNWTTSNWSQLRSINYYLDNMRNMAAQQLRLHERAVGGCRGVPRTALCRRDRGGRRAHSPIQLHDGVLQRDDRRGAFGDVADHADPLFACQRPDYRPSRPMIYTRLNR